MNVNEKIKIDLNQRVLPVTVAFGLLLSVVTACGGGQTPQAPARRPNNLAGGSQGNSMSALTKSCTEKSCPPVSPTVSLSQIDGQVGSTVEHTITASASVSDRIFKVFPSSKEKPFDVTETVQGNELKISAVGNREILQGFYYVVVRDMDACQVKNGGVAARCQSLGGLNSEYDYEKSISVKIASNRVSSVTTSTAEDLRAAEARCRASQPPRPNPIVSALGALPGIIGGFSSGNPLAAIGGIASGVGSIVSSSSQPAPSITSCR